MLIIDLDKKICFSNGISFSEEYLDKSFKEYLDERYQENTAEWYLKEMWKHITMNIDKRAVFLVKNNKMYYISTEDLKIKNIPDELFEISNTAHNLLKEYFRECYESFKESINNYQTWNSSKINLVILKIANYKVPEIDELEDILDIAEKKFKEILEICLKEKMYKNMLPKIVDLYRKALMSSEPVLFINKVWGKQTSSIYAITEKLGIEKVSIFHIERKLEEMIGSVILKDSEFLVNRLYNYMMVPLLENVQPYIRINDVHRKGVNATLFLGEANLHLVADLDFKECYTFVKIKYDTMWVPYDNYPLMHIKSIKPSIALNLMKKVNDMMFQEIDCYVAWVGQRYEVYDESKYVYKELDLNLLYKLHNGNLEMVENTKVQGKESMKKIRKEVREAENRCYAFFQVVL